MKKSNVRGPAPAEKARKALGEKLNLPSKPPPSPNLALRRRPPASKPVRSDPDGPRP
ncbi:MAG TPA: hypothetical protein VGI60_11550 [Chthoniobacterales bacterium]